MSGLEADTLQLAQLAGCFCRPVSLGVNFTSAPMKSNLKDLLVMKVRLADAKDVKCQKAPARKDEVNLFALQRSQWKQTKSHVGVEVPKPKHNSPHERGVA